MWNLHLFQCNFSYSVQCIFYMFLVLKRRFFSNVQLWRPVSLNPVGVQRRTVSHFKGLFKTFKMRYSTFLYSYWIGLHVHFKKAILHLKRAKVRILFLLSVKPRTHKEILNLCAEENWKIFKLCFFSPLLEKFSLKNFQARHPELDCPHNSRKPKRFLHTLQNQRKGSHHKLNTVL